MLITSVCDVADELNQWRWGGVVVGRGHSDHHETSDQEISADLPGK